MRGRVQVQKMESGAALPEPHFGTSDQKCSEFGKFRTGHTHLEINSKKKSPNLRADSQTGQIKLTFRRV